jgi:hypothetical protein
MLSDGNTEQSFTPLTPKPNGQNKSMGRTTENHPIQQTPGIRRTVTFADRAFRNSSLQLDEEGLALGRSPS